MGSKAGPFLYARLLHLAPYLSRSPPLSLSPSRTFCRLLLYWFNGCLYLVYLSVPLRQQWYSVCYSILAKQEEFKYNSNRRRSKNFLIHIIFVFFFVANSALCIYICVYVLVYICDYRLHWLGGLEAIKAKKANVEENWIFVDKEVFHCLRLFFIV